MGKEVCIISAYAYIVEHVNYGSLLQYYALEKELKLLGYNPYWLRFVLPSEEESVQRKLKNVIKYIINHEGERDRHNTLKKTMRFVSEYLNVSDCIYDEKRLDIDPPKAEAYITGSDQVWGGTLKPNYLTFVPDGKLKISYAASFGKSDISEEQLNTVAPWIKRLDYISVRETSGKGFCKKIGVDADKVLDPTLLISSNRYPTNQSVSQNLGKFYFGYFLNVGDQQSDILKLISTFTTQKHTKMIYAGGVSNIDKLIPRESRVYLSPEEWLGMYNDAEAIFTNTFHGTVFALIYHKNFIVFLQKGKTAKQNERLYSLLQMIGLESRVYDETKEISIQLQEPIEWERVESIIAELRGNSIQFLKDALERKEREH